MRKSSAPALTAIFLGHFDVSADSAIVTFHEVEILAVATVLVLLAATARARSISRYFFAAQVTASFALPRSM